MRLVKYLESLSSSSSERADERRKREETDFDARLAPPPPQPSFREAGGTRGGRAGSKGELLGKPEMLIRFQLLSFPPPASLRIPQMVSILPLSGTTDPYIPKPSESQNLKLSLPLKNPTPLLSSHLSL